MPRFFQSFEMLRGRTVSYDDDDVVYAILPQRFSGNCSMATTLSLLSATAAAAPTVAPTRSSQTTQQPYPNFKIIVLNDDFNTFQHVTESLLKHIPGMTAEHAWELTNQIHFEGQAIVWVGPQEQAELYHMQLGMEGLTMAPLEAA